MLAMLAKCRRGILPDDTTVLGQGGVVPLCRCWLKKCDGEPRSRRVVCLILFLIGLDFGVGLAASRQSRKHATAGHSTVGPVIVYNPSATQTVGTNYSSQNKVFFTLSPDQGWHD